jgi:hypothetical protein
MVVLSICTAYTLRTHNFDDGSAIMKSATQEGLANPTNTPAFPTPTENDQAQPAQQVPVDSTAK